MRIGFIGFGEAAQAFRRSLAAADPALGFLAYDILLDGADGAAMRAAMAGQGVTIAAAPAPLQAADWVVSAVTADQSLAAVRALAPHLVQGQLVIDINSVAPDTKRASAALVEAAGAGYLDMAVMAPALPRGHHVPVLVAGSAAERAEPELRRLGFDYRIVGAEAGAATAIKMVRSLFVKGLEAITVETLLAAEASGCLDAILASLSGSYPGLGWPDFAAYTFERTLRHGARRAAEMRESAATLEALGLGGALAREIAEVHARMGRCDAPPPPADDLATGIVAVLATRVNRSIRPIR